ncbi:MAG: hypothetical protein HY924_10045 [Elusimicrobia bacterium]|nr:hypothetical protein [Elusimicrobiota bacterium]
MRMQRALSAAVLFVLSVSVPASASYWKLAGSPEFASEVNAIPALQPGESKTINDGEGGVTTTLAARTATHAEFVTVQPRYGTHRMRYDWDAPPKVIRPGDVPTLGLRWEILQRYTRFCPQMMAFSHLDWSDDWYTNLGYGYGNPTDLKPDQNSGEVRNTTIKVTSRDSAELTLYRHVSCGGAWVRVLWKYKRMDGEPPAEGASGSAEYPEWIMQGSKVENGFVYGVGIGESKAGAAALALAELVKTKKTYAAAAGSEEQRLAGPSDLRENFGPISLKQTSESGLVKDKTGAKDPRKKLRDVMNALEAEEKGDVDTQYVTMVTKVALKSGKDYYEIEVEMESISDLKQRNEEESKVEVRADNMSVSDLFKEFNRQGMQPQTFYSDSDGTHYVSLRAKATPRR